MFLELTDELGPVIVNVNNIDWVQALDAPDGRGNITAVRLSGQKNRFNVMEDYDDIRAAIAYKDTMVKAQDFLYNQEQARQQRHAMMSNRYGTY